MLREIKPKNARSARVLKNREAKVVENAKTALFLKATNSSALVNGVATDLHSLKRPLAVRFTKKNAIHPFEDASSFEFFSEKNDVSLICFSSHSKKRPHNLTMVRTFGGKILDMIELLADSDSARLMSQFGGSKARVGIKPIITFSGPQFEDQSDRNPKFRLAKSVLMDFFKGEDTTQIDVEGLQMVISFAASEVDLPDGGSRQMVHMRVWRVLTKRSGQKMPRIELEEMGPRVDLRLGRIQEADESMLKEALKQSKHREARTRKNIGTDLMGDKIGQLHMSKQDLGNLQTRKMKGLKRSRDAEFHEDVEAEEMDQGSEDDDSDDSAIDASLLTTDEDEIDISGGASDDAGLTDQEGGQEISPKRQRTK